MTVWYALRVAPQREFTVEAMLRRKGYEVFCPIEQKSRKASRKGSAVKVVSYALFNRYIFIGGAFSWLHLMAENHVSGFVWFLDDDGERQPAPIADSEMIRLRAMSGKAIPHRQSVNPHRALRTGELAEITKGALAGQIVKVEGLYGRKARIFINLFGTLKHVEIKLEDLIAA
jgi:transcription antitermination factor NusG